MIAYFLKEIETLSRGISVFCPREGRFVRIQMALLAYLADRPERHTILNQAQTGIVRKRTLWSAVVDHKNLPFCKGCFKKEIKSLLDDRYIPSCLTRCG